MSSRSSQFAPSLRAKTASNRLPPAEAVTNNGPMYEYYEEHQYTNKDEATNDLSLNRSTMPAASDERMPAAAAGIDHHAMRMAPPAESKSAGWIEELQDVKWGLQVASMHNTIQLDLMAMQGLDEKPEEADALIVMMARHQQENGLGP
ncbi:expressed unknown protein [Seminavis robusta]|uniref:Uncharacterized protein n=1 Tax=Seminavis robusta TaxID=568900 RepID=A0A9N8DAE2_9STRA|nr:expressed unknown protein [Seminavis robusta]|eukprot:Sro15_g010850.1 n/a (148) ;mRNA; f:13841-14386